MDREWTRWLRHSSAARQVGRVNHRRLPFLSGKPVDTYDFAQYLTSDDYASLTPGYWVVYYDGSFANSTEAVAYCAAHGLTTANQCVGRYLSNNPADITYMCRPPGGPGEASRYRP